MEAKQEKENAVAQALIEAKTERLETAADAKQQELLKVCDQNNKWLFVYKVVAFSP